jgi:hypothetical protein
MAGSLGIVEDGPHWPAPEVGLGNYPRWDPQHLLLAHCETGAPAVAAISHFLLV